MKIPLASLTDFWHSTNAHTYSNIWNNCDHHNRYGTVVTHIITCVAIYGVVSFLHLHFLLAISLGDGFNGLNDLLDSFSGGQV